MLNLTTLPTLNKESSLILYIIIPIVVFIIVLAILGLIIFIIRSSKANKNLKQDFYSKSRATREGLGHKLRALFVGRSIDEKTLEELEEVLIKADIGPRTTNELIEKLRKQTPKNIEDAILILKDELKNILIDGQILFKKGDLNVFLILGVNGVGKTTSIAKLANWYLKKGFKVLLAAGDTFRAAAVEQLSRWANKLNIPIIKQKEKTDPSGIAYDAIDSARARGVDLLLIDTAGRLHNKIDLMEELKKIGRVIEKKGNINKKNILIIDATTGQNAYQQAFSFNSAIGIDGVIIAKCDAQSKGGIIINIQKNLDIPFYFIGTGEKLENLKEFKKDEFVENIFS
ncbi:MAG: signal recognition particle-docking protein FtsY [Spirochaetes bacterium]|nr:signal recognition particle-docking protein FtsY [Spirochaetota bacterium]